MAKETLDARAKAKERFDRSTSNKVGSFVLSTAAYLSHSLTIRTPITVKKQGSQAEHKVIKKLEENLAASAPINTIVIGEPPATSGQETFDLWDDSASTTRRRKPPPIKANSLPLPGNSYRPKFEDHQDVLGAAVVDELSRCERQEKLEKKLKVREKIRRRVKEMTAIPFPAERLTNKARLDNDNAWSFDDSASDDESDEASNESDAPDTQQDHKLRKVKQENNTDDGQTRKIKIEPKKEDHEGNEEDNLVVDEDESKDTHDSRLPTRAPDPKRKTKKQRKKEQRIKDKAKEYMRARTQKRVLKDLDRIQSIEKQLDTEDEQRLSARILKQQQLRSTKGVPKRIGKHLFQEPIPDVLLTEELPNSLLQVSTKGNLLRDQFRSMQRNNIIETRETNKRTRRYPKKVYEKFWAKGNNFLEQTTNVVGK